MNRIAGSEEYVMQQEEIKALIHRGRLLRNEMIYQSCLRFIRHLKDSILKIR